MPKSNIFEELKPAEMKESKASDYYQKSPKVNHVDKIIEKKENEGLTGKKPTKAKGNEVFRRPFKIAEEKSKPDNDEAKNGETDENNNRLEIEKDTSQEPTNNPPSKLERFKAANYRLHYELEPPNLRIICERWINKVSKHRMMYKEEVKKEVSYLPELEAPMN
ncbi:3251_t:CDS:2 [Cetraspora pellucida]|uniref:3251_t:CDS:1 n=1 Tax=Cetraspora pellucida TaxID=1433469 RepID=A0A9N9EKV4_9GLOM|nr:3251_t:CDS:2 [Cetraspora pellucida]